MLPTNFSKAIAVSGILFRIGNAFHFDIFLIVGDVWMFLTFALLASRVRKPRLEYPQFAATGNF